MDEGKGCEMSDTRRMWRNRQSRGALTASLPGAAFGLTTECGTWNTHWNLALSYPSVQMILAF